MAYWKREGDVFSGSVSSGPCDYSPFLQGGVDFGDGKSAWSEA